MFFKEFKQKYNLTESTHLSSEKNIDHWTDEPGTRYGSNEGGIHYDEDGNKHYVKFYRNPQQSRAEVAASRIHEMMGVKTNNPFLIRKNGKVGVATKWNHDIEKRDSDAFEKLNAEQAHQLARIHHAAVLTKNWDVVGLEHDNINFHKKTGELYSVDHGGTFNFRAQGSPKNYGEDIDETKTFRNPQMNWQTSHVFNGTFDMHPDAEKHGLDSVKNLNYNKVKQAMVESGLHDAESTADTLWKRRKNLLNHYGEKE